MFLLVYSCKIKEHQIGSFKTNSKVVVNKSLLFDIEKDHTIDTAYIQRDSIFILVNFSNVCISDTFELVSNGKYGKSNPPIIGVMIKRKSLKTDCKGKSHSILKFDITPLRYLSTRSVIINIDENYKVKYNY